MAQQFTERMGRPFVVENRAGATGMIGAEIVAKAQPDGHTLYIASQTTHAVAPYMYAKPLYDPVKEFATISLMAHNPLLIVVHPSFGEVTQSLAQPAVKEQMTKLGLEIVGSAPDHYAQFLRAENVKWGNMVRQLKLKAD